MITAFTLVIPERIRRAISTPARDEAANTAPARPYDVALVRLSASSTSGTRVTVTVGPKVSSVTALLSSGTSTSTVGATQAPSTVPPVAARPPRDSASVMCRATTPACDGIVIGPYDAPSSEPGRSVAARRVISARKPS